MSETSRRLKPRARKRGQGEGSIYQRSDGMWIASLRVGVRSDGHPDRRKVAAKTRAEVQKKLDDLRQRSAAGLLGEAVLERATVGEFMDQWLEAICPTVRPRTWERYEELVRLHIRPVLGRQELASPRPSYLVKFYAQATQKGLSPRTVQYLHATLRRSLGTAVKWGAVPRNVASVVDAPRVPKRELHPPTVSEVASLLDTAWQRQARLAALWTVAVYSGCRLGELLGLQWTDINLDERVLTVRRGLERVHDMAPVFSEPKSARSRRSLRLPEEAAEALRKHRVRQTEERLATSDYAAYGLVFATSLGTPLIARNVERDFKLALARAGVRTSVRFHDLRHFAATIMLAARVHPKVASERLGHSQIGITLDLYSHVVAGLDTDAADRIERALRGQSSQVVPPVVPPPPPGKADAAANDR